MQRISRRPLADAGTFHCLDLFDERLIPIPDKIDHETLSTGAYGSTHAVEVCLQLIGQMVVDDPSNMLDV
jgi:hypothetical protein